MMNRLLACLTLVILAAPVAACGNDSELPNHEREFRSSYKGESTPTSIPSQVPLIAYAGTGLLLGLAGTLLAVMRRGE